MGGVRGLQSSARRHLAEAREQVGVLALQALEVVLGLALDQEAVHHLLHVSDASCLLDLVHGLLVRRHARLGLVAVLFLCGT